MEPGKYYYSLPDFVRMLAGEWAFPDRSHYVNVAKLDPPSEKQVKYLRALGFQGESPKTKGEASRLINIYKAK